MSQNETKLSCVKCKGYLFEEDDVVYCPVCGAPHHRECYNAIGHCALEESHGTENQYDLLKKKSEEKQKPAYEVVIPQSNNTKDEYTPGDEIFENLPPMDFLGGIPADFEIEKGITAKETRNFVISNTHRYIPKFTELSNKNKSSWNFIAFFFPTEWLLSRKMYKKGIIVGMLFIIATLLSVPLNNTFYNLGIFDLKNSQEIAQTLLANMADIHWGVWIAEFVGLGLSLTLRLVVAMLGDFWYRGHVMEKIKEIKETSDDIAEDFRRKGGVSLFMFLLGLLATQYLPSIIASLFL